MINNKSGKQFDTSAIRHPGGAEIDSVRMQLIILTVRIDNGSRGFNQVGEP